MEEIFDHLLGNEKDQVSLMDILWYSLFDWPESGFVRAKKHLAGHHGRLPAVRYFQPRSTNHDNFNHDNFFDVTWWENL